MEKNEQCQKSHGNTREHHDFCAPTHRRILGLVKSIIDTLRVSCEGCYVNKEALINTPSHLRNISLLLQSDMLSFLICKPADVQKIEGMFIIDPNKIREMLKEEIIQMKNKLLNMKHETLQEKTLLFMVTIFRGTLSPLVQKAKSSWIKEFLESSPQVIGILSDLISGNYLYHHEIRSSVYAFEIMSRFAEFNCLPSPHIADILKSNENKFGTVEVMLPTGRSSKTVSLEDLQKQEDLFKTQKTLMDEKRTVERICFELPPVCETKNKWQKTEKQLENQLEDYFIVRKITESKNWDSPSEKIERFVQFICLNILNYEKYDPRKLFGYNILNLVQYINFFIVIIINFFLLAFHTRTRWETFPRPNTYRNNVEPFMITIGSVHLFLSCVSFYIWVFINKNLQKENLRCWWKHEKKLLDLLEISVLTKNDVMIVIFFFDSIFIFNLFIFYYFKIFFFKFFFYSILFNFIF